MRNFRRSSDHNRGLMAVGVIFLGWLTAVVLVVGGWIMNIADLVRMSDSMGPINEWTLVIWLKIIGVVMVPLGSIMGWFF